MTTYFRKGEPIIVELYHGSNVEMQYPEIRKAKFTAQIAISKRADGQNSEV